MADLEINRRLKKLITEVYKVTPYAFSQKYHDNGGVKTSQILRERNGVSTQMLETIIKAYPEINREWLLTGKGDMLNAGKTSNTSLPEKTDSSMRRPIRYWLDIEATGGNLVSFDDLPEYRHIDISIPEFGDCTDAINLNGDSMEPNLKPGQIIILKQWNETFIDYGHIYLIITKSGNRMVKVLRSIAGQPDKVSCVSYNQNYDPFTIDRSDILRLYLVKGAIDKLAQ